jgi:hypothetical protein
MADAGEPESEGLVNIFSRIEDSKSVHYARIFMDCGYISFAQPYVDEDENHAWP